MEKASEILIGKNDELELSLIAALCRGHLLIEDIPGVGKTTLVQLVSKLLGLNFSRIQFTNDLLPSDILGFNLYDKNKGEFVFKKGPIFGELVLADELNRASPKTQSALLQVMEEHHISIDGEDFKMEGPFLVFATQNPFQQIGTSALPESQLDRFFMGISLGLPDRKAEKEILKSTHVKERLQNILPVMMKDQLIFHQNEVLKVHVKEELYDYVLNVMEYGRNHLEESFALSTRAAKDLILAAKARAYLYDRDYVILEDIQGLCPYVLGHRVGFERGLVYGINIVKEMVLKVRP